MLSTRVQRQVSILIVITTAFALLAGSIVTGNYIRTMEINATTKTSQNVNFLTNSLLETAVFDEAFEVILSLEQNRLIKDFGHVNSAVTNLFTEMNETSDLFDSIFISVGEDIYYQNPMNIQARGYFPINAQWYYGALATRKFHITKPYYSPLSKMIVFSICKSFVLEDGRMAIVGVTIEHEELIKLIETWMGENLNLVLVTNEGEILYNNLASNKDFDQYLTKDIIAYGRGEHRTKFSGTPYYMIQEPINSAGLTSISLHDLSQERHSARRSLVMISGMYIIITAVLILFLMILLKRYLSPFHQLGPIVESIGSDSFTSGIRKFYDKHKVKNESTDIVQQSVYAHDRYKNLVNTCDKMVEEANEGINKLEKRIESQKKYINYLVYHDPLTKLPNRVMFREMLNDCVEEGKEGGILLIDIDNFKAINDNNSHLFGDQVLIEISKRLSILENDNMTLFRFGGDEFIILYVYTEERHDMESFSMVLKHAFDEPFVIDSERVPLNFSMGISLFPLDSSDPQQLLANADMALHSAKSSGKDGFRYFDGGMSTQVRERQIIESHIKYAIENDGFYMVYQPQVQAQTGKLIAFEALIRMKDGSYYPNEFIPIAEDNGMIIDIGRIVTKKVIQQLAIWKEKGYAICPISVNYSVRQMHDRGYQDFLFSTLRYYNVSPEWIEIEITENIFVEDQEDTYEMLSNLKKAGVKVSIDDFGTGYSSISYLTFMPLDKIKLDRSLIMKTEVTDDLIIDSMIMLSHSLGIQVVAEGVEDIHRFRALRARGCDIIQGYYFSPPVNDRIAETMFDLNFVDAAEQATSTDY